MLLPCTYMFPCSWMFFFPSFSTPLVSGVYVCSPSPPWNPSAFLSPRAASTCFLADSMDTCARDGTIETKGMAPVPGVVWIWVTMVKVVQTESILGKKIIMKESRKGFLSAYELNMETIYLVGCWFTSWKIDDPSSIVEVEHEKMKAHELYFKQWTYLYIFI